MPIRTVSGSTTSPVGSGDANDARRRGADRPASGIRQNPEVRTTFGLGDAVEVIARPFARLLGKTNCADCKRRKELLNAKLPSLNPFRLGKP